MSSRGSIEGKPHVAQWKKDEVATLAAMLRDRPVVAIAQIGGIPAPQMQEMRATLRGSVDMVGTKNRLLRLAIDEAAKERPGVAGLKDKVDGQVAVLGTDMNPFSLYKALEAGKSFGPVKAGSPAPQDITVQKGPTPFGPGPIVGEFQKAGIPAKIEGPKVVIQKTVTPVKKGETVSADLAGMLAKLEIKPVELKIHLQAACDADTVFLPDVLDVDEDALFAQVSLAARQAYEVALEAVWPTKQTVGPLIGRAYRATRNLSLDAAWVTKDTAEELIARARKAAVGTALESGFDLGDGQDAAAEAYANILAGIGKAEGDLSDDLKERLEKHLGILRGAGAAPAAAAPAESSEAKAEEEEEEEEVSEEDAAAGLGSLFG